MSTSSFSNPFEKKEQSDINAVYFGHFNDIPIPQDMIKNNNRTEVSFFNDQLSGVEFYEGPVEIISLSLAMEHNMRKTGWTLLSQASDEKFIQLYKKENRHAVIYFYEQTLTTAMEIWLLTNGQKQMYSPPQLTPTHKNSQIQSQTNNPVNNAPNDYDELKHK